MPVLLDLFFTFAKIGLFTFGGGYAMIAMIDHDCVEQKQWISHDEMMDITVIAESTPGPIAINCATFVGYRQAGLLGAFLATFGMVLPSFLIIYLISRFLDYFMEIAWIAHAFRGIKIAVGLLIIDAAFKMIRKMKKKGQAVWIMTGAFLLMLGIHLFSWNCSSMTLLVIAGVISLLIFLVGEGRKK